MSTISKKPAGLTQKNLGALKEGEEEPQEKMSSASRSSRTTAILRSIIRKATTKEGEVSETPSEYKQKVIGLVK